MGIFSNKVQAADLQAGDHIYTWRGLLYSHHGIYVGGGQVIHHGTRSQEEENMIAKAKKKALKISVRSNSKWCAKCKECNNGVKWPSGVSKICLDCFLEGGHLYRYEYGVRPIVHQVKRPGTCTPHKASEVEMILHRAEYLLAHELGFGQYQLIGRNCEDFALYCRLGVVGVGKGLSGQVASLSVNIMNSDNTKSIQVEDLVVELGAHPSTSSSNEF